MLEHLAIRGCRQITVTELKVGSADGNQLLTYYVHEDGRIIAVDGAPSHGVPTPLADQAAPPPVARPPQAVIDVAGGVQTQVCNGNCFEHSLDPACPLHGTAAPPAGPLTDVRTGLPIQTTAGIPFQEIDNHMVSSRPNEQMAQDLAAVRRLNAADEPPRDDGRNISHIGAGALSGIPDDPTAPADESA